ncbi:MAG: hypothetical protein GEU99_20540 [Luteitalea sp.]|nr:hypothetical protein [Luteitalea sp.]
MQKRLIWVLLAFAPLIGVRIVCVEGPGAAPAALTEDASNDCHQICLRRNGPPSGEDCLLLADGSLLVLMSAVAVLPMHAPIRVRSETATFEVEVPDCYLAPVLDQHSPPPKA